MNNEYVPVLITATLADYPTIQNMARFYVYDRTVFMGWPCPENGLFDCIDFKHYFENPNEKAFIIRVNNEIAGFVLLDKMKLLDEMDMRSLVSQNTKANINWNMGEFFVLAKFQGKGVASAVAKKIFKDHPGQWTVAVMPENSKAVKFWRKIISDVTSGAYSEVFKTEEELRSPENPDPYAMNVIVFEIENEK
jgi:predicted acetyltransferase